jgi:CheY-like chemotaxis protein
MVVTETATRGALILVVDDDEAVLEALADFLVVSGYQVACATNGARALDYLRNNPPPALVVHDLVMPIMDGWRLRKEMKKDSALAKLPVVVISAVAEISEIDAEAVLVKPFDIAQFLAIVSRLTHSSDGDGASGESDPK